MKFLVWFLEDNMANNCCGGSSNMSGGTVVDSSIVGGSVTNSNIIGGTVTSATIVNPNTQGQVILDDTAKNSLVNQLGPDILDNIDDRDIAGVFNGCDGQPLQPGDNLATCKGVAEAIATAISELPPSSIIESLTYTDGVLKLSTTVNGQFPQSWEVYLPVDDHTLTGGNTTTTTLRGDGTVDNPLYVDVNVSPFDGNLLTVTDCGLCVDTAAVEEAASVVTADTNTVSMTGNGSVCTPLSSVVKVSAASGNAIEVHGDGLYVTKQTGDISLTDVVPSNLYPELPLTMYGSGGAILSTPTGWVDLGNGYVIPCYSVTTP